MNSSDFASIHPKQGNMGESELRLIENKCITNKNYDILVISINNENNYQV